MLEKINHKIAPKEVVNALVTLYHQGKFDDVLSRSSQLIEEYPHTFVLHNIIGAISFEKGHKETAIEHFRKVIELHPHHPHAYNNLGAALIDVGEYEEAKSNLKKAIELQPDYAEAYNNLGNVYKEMEEYNQAITEYEKAIELNPAYYEAYNNLGAALGKNEQYEKAEKVLKQVIKLQPELIESLNNLGSILTCMEKYEEAKAILNRLIKIQPSNAEALSNLGDVYRKLNEYEQAIDHYKRAIQINPNYYEVLNSMGLALTELEKYSEAKNILKKAIKINPDFAEAYNNLGNVYKKNQHLHKAILYYKKAIKIDKNIAGIHNNLGYALSSIGDNKNSIHHQKLAVALDPNSVSFLQSLLFYINYSPDMSAEEIFEYYKQYDQRFGLPHKNKWKPFAQPKVPKNKLKIGYVSPDFKGHSMQSFLLPALPYHDHKKFEILAFAELENEDKVSQEYKSYVDHWIRTDKMKDDELAQKIQDMGIDILVDVAGHTRNNRLTVFAQKPAPVSLSWFVGYAYTTGLSAIDYFLTDKFMAPKGSEHLFSEKLWRLNRYASIWIPKKNNMGEVNNLPALSKGFITFGTLTRTIRINDRVIKTWADILTKMPNSNSLLIVIIF